MSYPGCSLSPYWPGHNEPEAPMRVYLVATFGYYPIEIYDSREKAEAFIAAQKPKREYRIIEKEVQ